MPSIEEIPLEAKSASTSSRQPQPTAKPVPRAFKQYKNLQFSYSPSANGVDTNLLILLHGRGDNDGPFARLGKSLALPQTATLALRGPQIVPLLEEHEREWWNETDMLGMAVRPDPSFAIKLLCDIIAELTSDAYGWRSDDIHLFGFGQGGTLACEAGIALFRRSAANAPSLGTIVSVHGPLLSLPSSSTSKVPSVVKYVSRGNSTSKSSDISALERVYTRVEADALPGRPGEVGMPRDRKEWEPIMRFWSERMRTRNAWELRKSAAEEIYEITGQNRDKVPIPGSTQGVDLRASLGRAGLEKGHPSGTANTGGPPAPARAPSNGGIPASPPATAAAAATTPKANPVSGFKKGFLSKGL